MKPAPGLDREMKKEFISICRIDHLDQASIEGLKAKLKDDLNTFLITSSEEQIASELRPYPRR